MPKEPKTEQPLQLAPIASVVVPTSAADLEAGPLGVHDEAGAETLVERGPLQALYHTTPFWELTAKRSEAARLLDASWTPSWMFLQPS